MSNFIKDTLQKQIERGEVFYYEFGGPITLTATGTGSTSSTHIGITTGVNETSLLLSATTAAQGNIQINEDSTWAGGIDADFVNMNFNSGNTTTTALKIAIPGTLKVQQQFIPNAIPAINPFGIEAGVILKPSTQYKVTIANTGQNTALFAVATYIREL